MSDINDRTGFGVLEGAPVFHNESALGTTPSKVLLPVSTPTNTIAAIKLTITNGSATAVVAYLKIARVNNVATTGATVGVAGMTATYDANTKQVILPGTSHTLSLAPIEDLWLVADSAGAKVNVGSYPFA